VIGARGDGHRTRWKKETRMYRLSLSLSVAASLALIAACRDSITIGDQPGTDGGQSADTGVAHDAMQGPPEDTGVARDAAPAGDASDASIDVAPRPGDGSVAYGYFYANPTDSGHVYGVPAGGGAAVVLASGDASSDIGQALTFDDRTLYFASEDFTDAASGAYSYSLHALPIAGGAIVTLASGLDAIAGLAVDASYLYFLDQGTLVDADSGAFTSRGTVERVALAPHSTPQVLATVTASLGGIAVDASYAYFTQTTSSSGGPSAPTGSVWRVPLAGGPSESLATGQLRPTKIVVDSGNLYWLNAGTMQVDCTPPDGALVMLSAGSAAPATVASALHGAKSLAARNGDVYWSTLGAFCNSGGATSGDVFKFASAAGTTATVASGISGPDNLYVDAADVYFTTVVDELNYILAATAISR
jgi:hypothetical protein